MKNTAKNRAQRRERLLREMQRFGGEVEHFVTKRLEKFEEAMESLAPLEERDEEEFADELEKNGAWDDVQSFFSEESDSSWDDLKPAAYFARLSDEERFVVESLVQEAYRQGYVDAAELNQVAGAGEDIAKRFIGYAFPVLQQRTTP